jgi:hypothetical protein
MPFSPVLITRSGPAAECSSMLKSLFGELTSTAGPARSRGPQGGGDFAATAILETVTGESSGRSAVVDRHVRDLLVTGSPAQAMRAHFATSREESQTPGRVIALHDPSGMWAGGVLKALADASGHPIERLVLRPQGGAADQTIATIERTTLPRRMDDTLKVYRADSRTDSLAGRSQDSVTMALLERSDMAAVIIGPMEPAAIDQALDQLRGATYAHTWRCTRLLFLLPVGAQWLSSKINAQSWPSSLKVDTLSEPLTSASAVWNALLAHWNRVKPMDEATTALERATGWGEGDFPIKVSEIASPAAAAPVATSSSPARAPIGGERPSPVTHRPAPDHARTIAALAELCRIDGMQYVALVDSEVGTALASDGQMVADIDRASQSAAQLMRGHRAALVSLGHANPRELIEEVVLTVGNRYHVLRSLRSHPELFLFATLDKLRSNLSMVRLRLLDAQEKLT